MIQVSIRTRTRIKLTNALGSTHKPRNALPPGKKPTPLCELPPARSPTSLNKRAGQLQNLVSDPDPAQPTNRSSIQGYDKWITQVQRCYGLEKPEFLCKKGSLNLGQTKRVVEATSGGGDPGPSQLGTAVCAVIVRGWNQESIFWTIDIIRWRYIVAPSAVGERIAIGGGRELVKDSATSFWHSTWILPILTPQLDIRFQVGSVPYHFRPS